MACDSFWREQSKRVIDWIAKLVSSVFFVGYVPVVPGTFGSLLVVVLYIVIPECFSFSSILVSSIVLFFLGVWSASRCIEFWGNDPSKVVIDEVVGMLVTFLFVPLKFKTLWAGFFIFRAFDIIKPPPIRSLERLPRGWGIMADDVIAGVYANIVLQLTVSFIPWMS